MAEESCWDLAVGEDGELPEDKAISNAIHHGVWEKTRDQCLLI